MLGWQVVNAARGRFVHPFLVADRVVGGGLVLAAGLVRALSRRE